MLTHSEPIKRLSSTIENSDAIIVGAGAGLSTAQGFTYDGTRFDTYFSDFKARYGFNNMYEGGFYPYDTLEEYWAYFSRYIWINRYGNDIPLETGPYDDLKTILEGKDYFIVTTNVDHIFQRVGFDKERLFYIQGNYGLFQCSLPCHKKTYDNKEAIRDMVERQVDMRIPRELVPLCPICHEPMCPNLRTDDSFVEDTGWHKAQGRYEAFLERVKGRKVVLLEIGVGDNTPVIIKYPFWCMAAEQDNSTYACINPVKALPAPGAKDRSIVIQDDAGVVLKAMRGCICDA